MMTCPYCCFFSIELSVSCRGCWTFGALCRGQIDPIFYLRPPVVLGVVGSNLKRKNGEKINNEYIINMNETNTRSINCLPHNHIVR